VDRFNHDDKGYVFRYKKRFGTAAQTLTVLKQPNGLFIFRTKCVYTSFFKSVANNKRHTCFCGIGTTQPVLIEEYDNTALSPDHTTEPPRESPLREFTREPTRESMREPMREPTREPTRELPHTYARDHHSHES